MTTLREVERIDKESAARRPRPKRERLTPALPWPKLSPMCPALFAALITWPTKLFGRLAPWLPWRIRPGRTWMSSSRVLMTLDVRRKETDGAWTIEMVALCAARASRCCWLGVQNVLTNQPHAHDRGRRFSLAIRGSYLPTP